MMMSKNEDDLIEHFHHRQHEYSHTGETPFECKIPGGSMNFPKKNSCWSKLFPDCDKKFTSKFKLKRHILIHSQTKTFLCDVCHRAFRRKDHLRNHEKVHDPGKTIYTCTYDTCARTYNSVTSFRKHQVSCVPKVKSQKLSHKRSVLLSDVTAVTHPHTHSWSNKKGNFCICLPKRFWC